MRYVALRSVYTWGFYQADYLKNYICTSEIIDVKYLSFLFIYLYHQLIKTHSTLQSFYISFQKFTLNYTENIDLRKTLPTILKYLIIKFKQVTSPIFIVLYLGWLDKGCMKGACERDGGRKGCLQICQIRCQKLRCAKLIFFL